MKGYAKVLTEPRCEAHPNSLMFTRVSLAIRHAGVITPRGDVFMCRRCKIHWRVPGWPVMHLGWQGKITIFRNLFMDELNKLGMLRPYRRVEEHDRLMERYKLYREVRRGNPRATQSEVCKGLGIDARGLRYARKHAETYAYDAPQHFAPKHRGHLAL